MKIKFLIHLIIAILFSNCQLPLRSSGYQKIDGFSERTNQSLAEFFQKTTDYKGRKVAVFDGDGTVLGQTPHYLADECLFMMAKNEPARKKAIINKMKKLSNVSIDYVQLRVKYLAGKTLQEVRQAGKECYHKYYTGKVFPGMKQLIQNLKNNQFEVWIITASPESLYQGFLSEELGIPITRIVGIKSVIRGGVITDEIIRPVAQDHGKKEAIETFVQTQPLLSGGNSRGDKEMIEFGKMLHLIVNPDTHIAHDQKESIADYAHKNQWLIIRQKDVPARDFPSISAKEYGIRVNKTKE